MGGMARSTSLLNLNVCFIDCFKFIDNSTFHALWETTLYSVGEVISSYLDILSDPFSNQMPLQA